MSAPAATLPFKVATLLYAFDHHERVLLIHRKRPPNQGLWSPFGGKVKTDLGESPYAGACREAGEEAGLSLKPSDLHLTGLVSEHGYAGTTHWLMFLFEIKPRMDLLPAEHSEGRFQFFHRHELVNLEIPQTDREQIWPLFWNHRGGFFAAHCHVAAGESDRWTVEESWPGKGLPIH